MSSPELVQPFSEPERELHKRLGEATSKPTVQQSYAVFEEMENNSPIWTTKQAAPVAPTPSVQKPDFTGENFEIKGQFLSMVQELTIDEKVNNDPNQHVENFLDKCDLFKNQGASDDVIRLRLFPCTIIGEAKGMDEIIGTRLHYHMRRF